METMTVEIHGPENRPDFEIGDRDGEHVATLSMDEARELHTALGRALALVSAE